ncbi:uncharacterized protein ACMZJ9_015232 [Mantella aurantiaca]
MEKILEEDLTIPHHHQVDGNPPERCPHPLYSRDSTQEDLTIPHHHQGEDVMEIKVEDEVEETYVRDDQQYTEEEKETGMMRTSIEEDTPTEISTGHAMEKPSKGHLTLSPGCKMEDEDITGEKTMISSMDGGDHSVERPWDPSDSEEPCTVRVGGDHSVDRSWDPSDSEEPRTVRDGEDHSVERPWDPSDSEEPRTVRDGGDHSVERPWDPSDFEEPHTVRVGSVTWEKTCFCPECGVRCGSDLSLSIHRRSHLEEKPYFCSECRKCGEAVFLL